MNVQYPRVLVASRILRIVVSYLADLGRVDILRPWRITNACWTVDGPGNQVASDGPQVQQLPHPT
jgi:hypothetical protein